MATYNRYLLLKRAPPLGGDVGVLYTKTLLKPTQNLPKSTLKQGEAGARARARARARYTASPLENLRFRSSLSVLSE